jgi:hypothetical protein
MIDKIRKIILVALYAFFSIILFCLWHGVYVFSKVQSHVNDHVMIIFGILIPWWLLITFQYLRGIYGKK